jgi:O-antigen ligase
MALLPGGLVVYFSFTAGGYFPASTGVAAAFLAVILGLRVALARDLGVTLRNPPFLIAASAMGLFASWTLISQLWSDAPARAMIEFDRALLYALALIVFGTAAAERRRVRWMLRGVAAGMVLVSVVALLSLLLPDVIPTTGTGLGDDRLSYPVTYWNALGLIAGVALVLSFHLTRSRREAVALRAVAAAAVPVTACTLYFTLSRGAIAATIVGLVAYVLLARRDGLLLALLSTVPVTAVALLASYDADLLTSVERDTAAAAAQGSSMAKIVGACALGALIVRFMLIPVEARLARIRWPWSDASPGVRVAGAIGAAGAALVIALAIGAPARVQQAYDDFFASAPATPTAPPKDARTRLTQATSNRRSDLWDVGMGGFRSEPLRGTGAGTFGLLWERQRPDPATARNAHSLYVETLSELGLVGFALLVLAIGSILVAAARRVRGSSRSVAAALLAAGLTWTIHAGVDWDWQLPATTVWFFALGGAVLASPVGQPEESSREPGVAPRSSSLLSAARLGQVAVGLGCFALAVLPIRMTVSQARLDASLTAFSGGDCPRAVDSAAASISAVARPEAYAALGYCDLTAGDARAAIENMQRAVDLDPRNAELRLALAHAQAVAGVDPRPAIREAVALNPLDPRLQEAERQLTSATSAAGWREAEAGLPEIRLTPGRGKSVFTKLGTSPAPTPAQ